MDIFLFAITIWFPFVNREDFERNGLTSIITVAVRDIQGQGFPEEHTGAADAVFLDLPQPWLAIPSAGTMLKQDGVLCSFSPCIEQVQRACEAMRSCFTGSMHAQNFFLCQKLRAYYNCFSWFMGANDPIILIDWLWYQFAHLGLKVWLFCLVLLWSNF